MLGSPGGRRRRLVQAFAPNHADDYYTSVHSSSGASFRRRRAQNGRSGDARKRGSGAGTSLSGNAGFRPIADPTAEHGYRINVARDGSMITAVPVDEQPLRGGDKYRAPQRTASPVLFGQPRSSPDGSVNGSTTWSTQGLLDARGKQRSKMRRMRPGVSNKPGSPIRATRARADDVVHNARDRLKHAKGFLAFTGTHKQSNQQPPRQTSKPPAGPRTGSDPRPRSTKVRWDLSPGRHRQPHRSPSPQLQVARSHSGADDESFASFPILSPNHRFDDSVAGGEEEKKSGREAPNDNGTAPAAKNGAQSFEALLQQRMAEIQSQQADLARKISERDVIKGTLVNAFHQNLERNQKQMQALDEELKELQWHLQIDPKLRGQLLQNPRSDVRDEVESAEVRIARNPSGAYDMDSVTVGDPSITADTDSVADLYRRDRAGRVMVTGLDPPARRSSPTIEEMQVYRPAAKEPDGPRISTVLRQNERGDGAAGPMRIPSPPTIRSVASSKMALPPSTRPPLHHQHKQPPGQRGSLWQSKRRMPPQSQSQGKFVQFHLPTEENDSAELKFESANSTETPSMDFAGEGWTSGGSGKDDISWKEEHFDVDAINPETGSVITSEHHDVFTWTGKEHVLHKEHYSRENHHRLHHPKGGVSSDSVETDPDLGFVHAVAAVVIQTAVRRFLAEIAMAERFDAVQVIQSTVCNWMARRQNYGSNQMYLDEQRALPRGQFQPAPFDQRSLTKRVVFEDDYNEFRDFAATEIQRTFRGWWARDGLDVDHFAATTLQRVFRGWWVREGLSVDRYCAVEIQRVVRGYLSRMEYIYDLYRIIVAQSVIRRYLAFYTSAVRLANVLYIQAIYRGYRVRAELQRYVRNGQEVAATFIQSQWRSYDAQMNYINCLADILIAQSVARRWLVLRKVKPKLKRRDPERHEPGLAPGLKANASGTHKIGTRVSQPAARKNPHAAWQQHRLKVVSKPEKPKAASGSSQISHVEGFDVFDQNSEGGDEWYDGNKTDASDMLKSWKGRKR
ncbi:hypothetical protein ACHAXT_010434 [Thalassiosira profunda]